MCIATAALIVGTVGAATSAYGVYSGGQASKRAAAYQAQVARNNSLIAESNARYAEEAGAAQAQATSLKGAAVGGKIKAAQAASNVDVNTGSAVNVQQSARQAEKLDTETVFNNAMLHAYGYRANATNFTAQAGLDELAGENAATGAEIGAVGSLLSNASSLGFRWGGLGGGGGGAGASPMGAGMTSGELELA